MNRELTTKDVALRHIGAEMVKRLEGKWGPNPKDDYRRFFLLWKAKELARFRTGSKPKYFGEGGGIEGREHREMILEAFREASEVRPIRLRRVIIREWLFELLI